MYYDRNLNAVTSDTAFEFTSGGNATATLSSSDADRLGLEFSQMYCQHPQPATGSCAMTCMSAPCYRVAKVGNYSYGRLNVVIAGTKAGPDAVTVAPPTNGIPFPPSSISGIVH
jgi:hypothetical protein